MDATPETTVCQVWTDHGCPNLDPRINGSVEVARCRLDGDEVQRHEDLCYHLRSRGL